MSGQLEKEVIIRIKAPVAEAEKSIKSLNTEIDKLANSTKSLKEAQKQAFDNSNLKAAEAWGNQIIKNQTELKGLRSEMGLLQKIALAPAESMSELRVQTSAMVREANNFRVGIDGDEKALTKLMVAIKNNKTQIREFDVAMGESRANVGRYAESLKGIGQGLSGGLGFGAAFGGAMGIASQLSSKLIEIGKNSVELALKAEGIEAAFKRIDEDGDLLEKLRKATKGTISDLELMQKAIRAKEFGVDVQKMGEYLEFARIRARETGKDVDELTKKLVEGLGAQSPRALKALGISASELREEMKKTGDFAQAVSNIIDRTLKKEGDAVLTNADKVSKAAAQWQNFQKSIGEGLLKAFSNVADAFDSNAKGVDRIDAGLRLVSASMGNFSALWQEFPQVVAQSTSKALPFIDAIKKHQDDMLQVYLQAQGAIADDERAPKTLGELKERLDEVTKSLNKFIPGSIGFKVALKEQTELEEKIAEALGKTTKAQKEKEKADKASTEAYQKEQEALKHLYEQEVRQEEYMNQLKVSSEKDPHAKIENERQAAIFKAKQAVQDESELRDALLKIKIEFDQKQADQDAADKAAAKARNKKYEDDRYKDASDFLKSQTDQQLDALTKENLTKQQFEEKKQQILLWSLQQQLLIEENFSHTTVDLKKQIADKEIQIAQEKAAKQAGIDKKDHELEAQGIVTFGRFLDQQVKGQLANTIAADQAEIHSLDQKLQKKLISQSQYDGEVKAIKRKEAEQEKASAEFSIILNTAVAIMKDLALTGWAFGAAAPAMEKDAITGAAELLLVAAKPVPYASGTNGPLSNDTLALVGDNPDGTPNATSEIVKLPKGAEVFNAAKSRQMLSAPALQFNDGGFAARRATESVQHTLTASDIAKAVSKINISTSLVELQRKQDRFNIQESNNKGMST